MDAGSQPDIFKVRLATWFAGLESGLVGVLWMLMWLGMSSLWQQRSFWTPENLMSTAFDRNAALNGLRWATLAGLAVYILIYSALGAVFAVLARERVARHRVTLMGILFAVAWYYLTFRWAFKYALPLVALLHVEVTMIAGHALYGAILGRFPVYVYRLMSTEPPQDPPMAPDIVDTPEET